jgi:hypothetical protein
VDLLSIAAPNFGMRLRLSWPVPPETYVETRSHNAHEADLIVAAARKQSQGADGKSAPE